jgi:hypothetical protein
MTRSFVTTFWLALVLIALIFTAKAYADPIPIYLGPPIHQGHCAKKHPHASSGRHHKKKCSLGAVPIP